MTHKRQTDTQSEEIRNLVLADLDQSKQFDKYILLLSGGSFGVSFAFIQQVVPNPSTTTVPWLIGSWTCFGISILSTLVSFLFSQRACKRAMEIKRSEDSDVTNTWANCTEGINWNSMAFFILGLATLIIFAAANML